MQILCLLFGLLFVKVSAELRLREITHAGRHGDRMELLPSYKPLKPELVGIQQGFVAGVTAGVTATLE